MTHADEVAGRLLACVARLVSGTSAQWVDCVPSTRQRIYFANHGSHLDIVILWSALPRPVQLVTRPVAARDYWQTNALRRYLAHRVFNVILISQGNLVGA